MALSGDGGDELFLGYGRYADALRIWRRIGSCSSGVRRGLALVLESAGRLLGGGLGFRLDRFGQRIDTLDFDAYYANLLSLSLSRTAADGWPEGLPGDPVIPAGLADPDRRMMFADQSAYLPEDILTKTDRASMAASLELRVPLIDHRVVELAWQIPIHFCWNGRNGKLPLRRLLYRLVPQKLVDRPKQGFEIPIDSWLRGALREWTLDLLSPIALEQEHFLDADAVSTLVTEHLSGRGNYGYALWPALMFQSWRRASGLGTGS